MKGKSSFSPTEAERIRELLRQIRRADRDAQRTLRGSLRSDMGFFITDFTSSSAGFTCGRFRRPSGAWNDQDRLTAER